MEDINGRGSTEDVKSTDVKAHAPDRALHNHSPAEHDPDGSPSLSNTGKISIRVKTPSDQAAEEVDVSEIVLVDSLKLDGSVPSYTHLEQEHLHPKRNVVDPPLATSNFFGVLGTGHDDPSESEDQRSNSSSPNAPEAQPEPPSQVNATSSTYTSPSDQQGQEDKISQKGDMASPDVEGDPNNGTRETHDELQDVRKNVPEESSAVQESTISYET
jgi:hypothetical protein